tara:strand:- start:530 stop:1381 length:852 start_codon:yes stop_codon:yes gene_type:complete
MNLTEEIKNKIISHSKREYPNECGGIILTSIDEDVTMVNDSLTVIESKNLSSNPQEEFVMAKELINRYHSNIKFIYHSHTKGQKSFSTRDKMVSEKLEVPLVLFDHKNKTFDFYYPNGFIPSLTGRSWEDTNSCNKIGCFSVVSDYYKKILKIEMSDYEKIEIVKNVNLSESDITTMLAGTKSNKRLMEMINAYRENQSFDLYLEQNSFVEVSDLKKHDIIGMKGTDKKFAQKLNIDFSIHFAIYLEGGVILHQPYMRDSRIEKLTNDHRSLIHKIYRHESKL